MKKRICIFEIKNLKKKDNIIGQINIRVEN